MRNSLKLYLYLCITRNEHETQITLILLTTKYLVLKITPLSQNVILIMGILLPCIIMWLHRQININNVNRTMVQSLNINEVQTTELWQNDPYI